MGPYPIRRVDAHALFVEVYRIGQQLCWKYPIFDDTLLMVQIVDEQVERRHALFEPHFSACPFVSWDNARDDIEGPGTVDTSFLRVNREGNAHGQDGKIRGVLTFLKFTAAG